MSHDERVTVRLPKEDLDDVDDLVDAGVFPSRSEAIRTAISGFVGSDERDERSRKRIAADGGRDE